MRRLRAVPAAALLIASASVLATSASAAASRPVAPAATPTAVPTHIQAAPFVVEQNFDGRALADTLPGRQSITDVVNDKANPKLGHAHCPSVGLRGRAVDRFCWNHADNSNCHEVPQGIATTGYVEGTSTVERQFVVNSWYHSDTCNAKPNQANWSFVTLNYLEPGDRATYAKVLLVEPFRPAGATPEQITLHDVAIHAGGVVWYGNYLYVADTDKGMRVFDMTRIMKVAGTSGGRKSSGRKSGGSPVPHGFRYALPQVGTVVTTEETPPLLWSALGLDDSATPSLVMAEYVKPGTKRCPSSAKAPCTARAVRFPLNPGTHKLCAHPDPHLICTDTDDDTDTAVHATEALKLPYTTVQGVVAHGSRWWFASSRYSRLYAYDDSATPKASWYPWVSWAEGLSYSDAGSPHLWSLRERKRVVFSVRVADFD